MGEGGLDGRSNQVPKSQKCSRSLEEERRTEDNSCDSFVVTYSMLASFGFIHWFLSCM